jgi:hypothetical protein
MFVIFFSARGADEIEEIKVMEREDGEDEGNQGDRRE